MGRGWALTVGAAQRPAATAWGDAAGGRVREAATDAGGAGGEAAGATGGKAATQASAEAQPPPGTPLPRTPRHQALLCHRTSQQPALGTWADISESSRTPPFYP